MIKNISIVGAGINGLLTAFLIRNAYPDTHLDIHDSEQHPVGNTSHKGVTHGSRDARHITGSESIGFESSIHNNALRSMPSHDTPGWLLKREEQLSENEIRWREEFEKTYTGSSLLNKIDYAHAELNYKGLAAWYDLTDRYSFIQSHIISGDGVAVYFESGHVFENDVEMETDFCNKYYPGGEVQKALNKELDKLYLEKLIVPGMSIRVKSLAEELLSILEKDNNVSFHWDSTVNDGKQLESEAIVWTSGITHQQPDGHQEHNLQGIIGCWTSIKSKKFSKPFKIAAPAPSAYINFTPDGNELHISGGFGWSGDYIDARLHSELARPVADHFIEQVNKYLDANITIEDIDYCVRPSTPTGQPILSTMIVDGVKNIFISGSAKSGTTHAPMLSGYVLDALK